MLSLQLIEELQTIFELKPKELISPVRPYAITKKGFAYGKLPKKMKKKLEKLVSMSNPKGVVGVV